ncbi:tripartite motif-containing protein 2-like [Babylonia areolata]|uniref:tripartite motif-containing protein 2-like n=1 Tax=Babylonia areolata TaxID=304850 RepID=UPI003FCFF57A
MATGGTEEDSNTCAVCLESYRNPKFLPCHHTFCAPCIQGLADHHPGRGFPCPSCREVISLPKGEVASLKTNFYIQPQSPKQKAGAQDMCQTHPDEKLRFYCVKCDEVICRDCKLTKHEGHETDDLTSAAVHKKEVLIAGRQRLQRAVSDVMERVTSLQKERQSLERKKAAVEKNIHDRHAIVVAAVDTHRDEELRSLESQHADLDKDVVGDIKQQEGNKAELSSLLKRLNDAITSGTARDVVTVANEITSGRGLSASYR